MLSLSERLPIALALAIDIALTLAIGTGLAIGLANAHDAKEKPEADEHAVRRAEVFSHPLPKAAYRNVSVITVEYPPGTESPKHGHDVAGDYLHSREAVQGMLGRLDDRERRILVSRYGIGGANELTLERLGRELGITKERVRQIQSQAQEKLREFALSAKDFFEEDHDAHTILHRPAGRLLAPHCSRMGQRRDPRRPT